MAKNLNKVLCCILLVVLVVAMCGCDMFSAPKAYGRYFATVDEMIEYFNPLHTAAYAAIRKPNDERFVDCGYLAYDYGDDSPWYILAFYEVEIDGEYVYVVFFSYQTPEKPFENGDVGKMGDVKKNPKPDREGKNLGYLIQTEGVNIEFNENAYLPEGFVKEINEGRLFDVDELINQSSWFSCCDIVPDVLVETWAIYDTRDVPQSEKDALALELMEILYNNYKLAGQKAE